MNDTGEIKLIKTISRGELTPTQIRCAAADEIEKRGWTQNQYESPEGHVCLAGAIYAVVYDHGDLTHVPPNFRTLDMIPYYDIKPVFDELAKILGTEYVSTWNDKPDRTEAEVIEVLRKDC